MILILQSLITLFSLSPSSYAQSNELSIVDVRRNIALSEEEPVYKDFYINGGEDAGLKKNLVITAFRKINVRDASGSSSFGEIEIPVGQVRVVAVYAKVAVAREYKLLSRDENPMLEQTGIMTGDKIDLKGSFIDNKIGKSKKEVAAQAPTSASAASVEVQVQLSAPPVATTATNPSPTPTTTPVPATAAAMTTPTNLPLSAPMAPLAPTPTATTPSAAPATPTSPVSAPAAPNSNATAPTTTPMNSAAIQMAKPTSPN